MYLGYCYFPFFSIFVFKASNPTIRLFRALSSLGIGTYLYVFAVDPSNALIAWFYLIVVYYTFALPSPQQYVVIGAVALAFTLAYMINPHHSGVGDYVARLSLMLLLGGMMGFVRLLVQRTLNHRIRLMDELRQARDDYAQQLTERTTELQKEIQDRKQTESQLAEERQLLRTVIDTFPSRLFVKDRKSRFILVNRWSLERHNLDNVDQIVGKTDFDLYPHFAERTYADEQRIMETGEPTIDWEETTTDSEGVERHYLISKVPMYQPETTEIVGIVGVTTEITSLKETQIALRQSEESLKLFQLRLKALNQITLNLTRIEAFDDLVYQSIKQGLEHLGFSRLELLVYRFRQSPLVTWTISS